MQKSELNCKKADLCLCLGTTLQILPVGGYPLLTKKNKGKIVIINLQPTKIDNDADLIINCQLDKVFEILMKKMFTNKLNLSLGKIEINLKLIEDDDGDLSLINVANTVIDPVYEVKIIANQSFSSKLKNEPDLLLIFSGKRKSGKDYICKKLEEKLYLESNIFSINCITLSAPLKKIYAIENNLDYEKLLDSSNYKENYRKDMIE